MSWFGTSRLEHQDRVLAHPDGIEGGKSALDVQGWWQLWSLAALGHLLGNPRRGGLLHLATDGVANTALAVVALLLLARPQSPRLRTMLAAGMAISFWFEAPDTGNHWLMAALVSLAALAAQPWRGGDEWWKQFAPSGRVLLIVFYTFAAFAKLNTGFLDTAQSCSRFFANRSLGLFDLPQIEPGTSLARAMPIVVIVIEASVPALLLIRPFRRFGIIFAVIFHSVLALDPIQHFYDFTLALIPLFLLFASPGVVGTVAAPLRNLSSRAKIEWFALLLALVVAPGLTTSSLVVGLSLVAAFALWLGWNAVLIARLLRGRWAPSQLGFRPTSPLLAATILLMAFNGLSPYLGLKSANGFNMYSNLVVGNGSSNHLVVQGTVQLRRSGGDLAIITATSDPGLEQYIDSGFALPMENLRDYLFDHPDAAVTFTRNGELTSTSRAGDMPGLLADAPFWREKLLLFRAVPLGDQAACQPSWLPAR